MNETKYRKQALNSWEAEKTQTVLEIKSDLIFWNRRLHKAVSQIAGWLEELQTRMRRRTS
ncbi:hypothetical protein [Paenibacillus tarimensis]|uniref:hypothetical protein n=1 Tax=Paenibacillus tarimensis TaxID=416012 RepID=UPI001F274002|nr:hypothetical protein [Paenibacillus tarimensis]MCF2944745.1 hypothetical protein [Paenibacillus tarimensis]